MAHLPSTNVVPQVVTPPTLTQQESIASPQETTTGHLKEHKAGRAPRTKFTQLQLRALESKFNENKCPSRQELQALAEELEISFNEVSNWFKNRQQKHKAELEQKRMPCTVFTDTQLRAMESKFNENKYPSRQELQALAEEL